MFGSQYATGILTSIDPTQHYYLQDDIIPTALVKKNEIPINEAEFRKTGTVSYNGKTYYYKNGEFVQGTSDLDFPKSVPLINEAMSVTGENLRIPS